MWYVEILTEWVKEPGYNKMAIAEFYPKMSWSDITSQEDLDILNLKVNALIVEGVVDDETIILLENDTRFEILSAVFIDETTREETRIKKSKEAKLPSAEKTRLETYFTNRGLAISEINRLLKTADNRKDNIERLKEYLRSKDNVVLIKVAKEDVRVNR